MADHQDSSLLREIDEDLRHEKYAALWKRYGNFIIAAVFLLVVSVAGYKGWQSYDLSRRTADGEAFAAITKLADSNQTEAAFESLSRLAEDGGSGYALLARFKEASLLAEQGNTAAAVAVFKAVAGDTGIDVIYRDLAVILSALHELDSADAAELTARLAPLAADDNPWRHSAKEIMSVLALRLGDKARARELLAALASDPTAPQGVRGRAAEMLATVGQ